MALRRNKKKNFKICTEEAVKIPAYGPHDALRPQDYMIPYLLGQFESNFEERCKSWLKNATPDMYNRGYMDVVIDKLEKEALIMLDIQRNDHESVIWELNKLWIGDRTQAEKKLKKIREEQNAITKEICMLENIYYKGTAYEDYYKKEEVNGNA